MPEVVLEEIKTSTVSEPRIGEKVMAKRKADPDGSIKCLLVAILLALLIAIGLACAAYAGLNDSNCAATDRDHEEEDAHDHISDHYHFDVSLQEFAGSLRPPGFDGQHWEDVLTQARGSTVNFWMWSGNPNINAWVDGFLTTRLRSLFGITLNRIPQGAPAAVTQVASEMASGAAGTCDLVWINGANFKNLMNGVDGVSHAYGPWANLVPNAAHFDFGSGPIAADHGVPTMGYEMPYNQAQSVFVYNSAQITSPPRTIPALVAWIQANSGRFAYSKPSTDFIGAMIVRTFFYHYAGGPEYFTGELTADNEADSVQRSAAVWTALNSLEPYLWSNPATNEMYPDAHSTVESLFATGTVWIEAAYDPNKAAQYILNNQWPSTAQSYVLDTGTISNTNFVAIPVNSPHKAAALAAGNFIGQLEAMFTRNQPELWGAMQSFDPTKSHIVGSGWNSAFDYIESHSATPSVEELALHRVGELDQSYVERINADWVANVLNA